VSGPAAALAGADPEQVYSFKPGSDLPETYPGRPGDVALPWLDQPAPVPPEEEGGVANLLVWEALSTRLTPADKFFVVQHYAPPTIDPTTWRAPIDGLVARPRSLSLDDVMSQPRRQVEFTLECSGNTGLPFFIGGIGNAVWGGAALAPLLRRCRPLDAATEVVFWGADSGTVTIRDNSGILSAGETGDEAAVQTEGLDITITEQFARSMTLADAMAPDNMLCYEMNGAPLPAEHGAPVRLIAPGWYGVANVKWLSRIQVTDHRFAGRFMARDYVTIREHTAAGTTVWTFETVGHARLKSAPAKVVRNGTQHRVIGVAWGGQIGRVDVAIDGGEWQPAVIVDAPRHGPSTGSAWQFWTYEWGTPAPGDHTVASRATDTDGVEQPAPGDPIIADKRTYWESNAEITRHVRIS
jgi:DMSO/TMAO reductase YedYZ molybdopterin-dependent catalytic subunit